MSPLFREKVPPTTTVAADRWRAGRKRRLKGGKVEKGRVDVARKVEIAGTS